SCLLLQFLDRRFRQKHEVTIGVEFGAKSAAGAILVYDITNRESFSNVARWLEEAKMNGNAEMCFVVVGNKCDMEVEYRFVYSQSQGLIRGRHEIRKRKRFVLSGSVSEDSIPGGGCIPQECRDSP
ncbi:UNVERIFIED_CONTAM: hypothetical protein GTU68_041690, partial [Idotea baltica]|nr:hypothetical protein [Idotea baltica]